MLKKDQFNEIKLTSVGQDAEKIQERVKEIWLPLTKAQREEVLSLSGLTIYAVMRSYQKGKLSLKLALALAQTQKVNPYYLSGASDEKDDFSNEIVKRFLTDNGHAFLVGGASGKPRRKPTRKQSAVKVSTEENTVADEDEAATDGVEADAASPAEEATEDASTEEADGCECEAETDNEPQSSSYDSMLSSFQSRIRALTAEDLEKLSEMPYETSKQLLKGLHLRAEFSEEAVNLSLLVKILLLM